ncbi:MAG TPA: histidine kinase dimerization/phospho-acceptor domain-containing protein, partial [Lachnospiraceae bacterium]|nr:histidine kinase dimerization/phospho-acceptor domain-containing protein [Lachnospiraceae bacterium]
MELRKCRTNTLFWMFLRRLLRLSASILVEIGAFVILFYICLITDTILPASYSEQYLQQNETLIANSEPFDEGLIPHTCEYGLFDLEGNYIEGDFSHDEVVEAELYIKDSHESDYRFYLIERENGYCIIKYDLSARFSSPILQKLFPNVELIFIIMFLLIFVSIVLYSAFSFGKKLRKELNPLLEEIGQIQRKELNMERKYSKIKEFNDILLSLYDMEIALTESLKKEWEMEQSIKSNISSIAHDIKTPLTIIKGNSELIKEEESMEEIYHSAEIINSNTDKVERYIKLLIDMTRSNQVE